jgi:four helix bundle protein
MASQIFRSGTSIGANIREAQNVESKKDFIQKLLKDLKSVILIISKIISSSKKL